MPSVEENRAFWESRYDWSHSGDEWSNMWGSPTSQWYGSILPRIRHFLPSPTILEIAPGMGRWTEFLLGSCDRLIGVDVTGRCVAACQARFASVDKATFFQNDGRTLPMIDDMSIDFAFSFDSLVHVGEDALESYVRELSRTLGPDGIAFLHHSNLGNFRPVQRFVADLHSKVPALRRGALPYRKVADLVGLPRLLRRHPQRGSESPDHEEGVEQHREDVRASNPAHCDAYVLQAPSASQFLRMGLSVGWRDSGPTAERFAAFCESADLHCIGQELIPWDSGSYLIDCISTVTRPGSKWDRPIRIARNPNFMQEGRSIGNYDTVYERG